MGILPDGLEPLTEREENLIRPLAEKLARVLNERNAIIEECARAAKKYIEALSDFEAQTMSRWDEIRHQVETLKGSDLPRLNFEGLIETIAEDTAAAIRALKDKP